MNLPKQSKVPFNRIYYILGFLCFAFYGIGHSIYGNAIVALTCLINCSALGACLVLKAKNKLESRHNDLLILCLSLTLIVVCSQLGMRGLMIAFPLISGYFYYYPLKKAVTYSVAFLIPALLAASFVMPLDMVLRTLIPIAMTVVISYLYSVRVARQKSKLREEAEYDYLTGIQNRRSLIRWLNQQMKHQQQRQNVSLFFLDIDNFKFINDHFGHSFGDKVLGKIAERMVQIQQHDIYASQQSTLARVAGDGFILALAGRHDNGYLMQFGERLLAQINQDYTVGEVKLQVNLSIGIATAAEHCSVDELVHKADVAMYKAKALGKNRLAFFDDSLAEEAQHQNAIALELKNALKNDEFFLTYMPLYDSKAQQIDGAEALLRSSNELLAKAGPDVYIPIAEEQGLIGEIDLMVIEKAFTALPAFKQHNPAFLLAINISSQQLKNQDFPNQVLNLAAKHQVQPQCVEFEITETSFVEHDASSIEMIKRLKQQGYRFALDDFGTGYTAFNQLRNLPVDTLKIDRSFIGNIDNQGIDQGELVDVILTLAQRYDLNVVAEGVENQHQLDYLMARDCDHFQGYFLSKPISLSALTELMADKQTA